MMSLRSISFLITGFLVIQQTCACGGTLNGSGIIMSPNFPDRYPSNAFCVWHIIAQGGGALRFAAIWYDVDVPSDCVKIYNSSEITENATIAGPKSSLFGWLSSVGLRAGRTAAVVFSSDASVERRGFSISFWSEWSYGNSTSPSFTTTKLDDVGDTKSIYPSMNSEIPRVACGGTLNGSGSLTSPSFPDRYPSNTLCVWHITAQRGNALRFAAISFDVDTPSDFVRIHNSSEINDNTTIAGPDASLFWWLSSAGVRAGRTAAVVFSSDASVERNGFSITFWSEWSYVNATSPSFTETRPDELGDATLIDSFMTSKNPSGGTATLTKDPISYKPTNATSMPTRVLTTVLPRSTQLTLSTTTATTKATPSKRKTRKPTRSTSKTTKATPMTYRSVILTTRRSTMSTKKILPPTTTTTRPSTSTTKRTTANAMTYSNLMYTTKQSTRRTTRTTARPIKSTTRKRKAKTTTYKAASLATKWHTMSLKTLETTAWKTARATTVTETMTPARTTTSKKHQRQ